MSFSKQLYDIYFDVAQTANSISYVMPVIGMSTYIMEQHKKIRQIFQKTTRQGQKLSAILKGTHGRTWEWNVQTGEIAVNEQWITISGYSGTETFPLLIQTWDKGPG